MAEPLPFEQQPGETGRAFAAFMIYRDLGPERCLQETAQRLSKNLTTIKQWSTVNNWVERSRSYDAALDARARQATEKDVIERRRRMLETHAQTAKKLQESADMILDEFNERLRVRGGMKGIDGRTLIQLILGAPKMLDAGQKLERLAEGEATEKHEHVITREAAEAFDFDELDAELKKRGLG